jgi:hypothetical protein
VLSVVVALVALWLWHRGRLARSLVTFEAALLVQLLVVQFFQLLDAHFIGYLPVLVNLALLGLCRALRAQQADPGRAAGDPAIPVGEEPAQGGGRA